MHKNPAYVRAMQKLVMQLKGKETWSTTFSGKIEQTFPATNASCATNARAAMIP